MNFDVSGDEALQAEKEDKQALQKDDERKTIDKIPDAIMSLEKYEVPFALVEVSGPHNQSNHHHFVSDKVKLAKQLKASLKKIRRMIEHGDEGLYEYIKLFWYSSTPKQDVPLQPVPAKLRHLCLRRSPLFRPCSPFWVYIKFWTRTRKESMEGEGSRRCWHEIS